ncbi:hypothetical protein DFA_06592 [Cavenderia fasciculata]|uniref:Tyrosine specific protein phosphatases domain-containing protein n=1 Tax=Cavenderia fasciculata TaxID=261658 RepID=F4PJF6_CACFS|nr:uncharacterized protein DFA_06592 [Cavenderia fasciculata]EGG24442.1 hypothetical protein DFA_06592 [Cavenderia fasciculata]|eukprot:XP_004362293.1 hypothetical protein DFA_06592 [Cavenderia fasciculata]
MRDKQLLLIALIAIISASFVSATYYLDPRKVRLVDHTPILSNGHSNYLFRGNEPKTLIDDKDVFAYDLLVEYMRNDSLSNHNVVLPESFYIIDIKLIYGLRDELPDIELESTFFANNSNFGEFNTNITLGDLTDPNLVPTEERIAWAKTLPTWQKDDLPSRMELYRDILYDTSRDESIVLYIHCECGCDRTGEVFASYVIKYLGFSFSDAMQWDYSVAGRRILPNHQWATQWYCLYLQYVEGSSVDCTPPPW